MKLRYRISIAAASVAAVLISAGVNGQGPINPPNYQNIINALGYAPTRNVDSIAALKALTTRPASVTVAGYYAANDGGDGVFNWVAGSTTTSNDCDVVTPTSGAIGRWKRTFSMGVNVLACGADPTGVSNSSSFITTALGLGYSPVIIPRGTYTLNSNVTIPANTSLHLYNATVNLCATLTFGSHASIRGLPLGMNTDDATSTSIINQANNCNIANLIVLGGSYNIIQDIVVDGNKANNATAGSNIKVTGNRITLSRLTTRHANLHGIYFASTGTSSEACCAKLNDVMSIANTGNGLYAQNTPDIFIDHSEFENNLASGIEADNSPTMRISNTDFGGNTLDGFYAHGAAYNPGVSLGSQLQIISGSNQFGNNTRYDINLDGTSGGTWGNVVVGNSFIGSANRVSNTYSAIRIYNNTSGGNSITGNVINSNAGHTFSYGVEIAGTNGYDSVQSNTFNGTYGTGYYLTGANTFFGNNTSGTGVLPMSYLFGLGPLVVGSNASISHILYQANDTELTIYSDTASQIAFEAVQASSPSTKYDFFFNKYGGNSIFGGNLTVNGSYKAGASVGVSCPAGFSSVTGRSVNGIVTAC